MSCIYCCCPPKKDYSTFLCCLPLSIAAILLAAVFGFWATWEITYVATSSLFPDYTTISILIFGIIKAIFAVAAVFALILRSSCLMNLCKSIFDGLILVCIIAFIYQWVVWGFALGGVGRDGGPWKPHEEDITMMVVVSIINVLVVIFGWWILGLLGSLACVYGAGGNGCERKSYKELSNRGTRSEV